MPHQLRPGRAILAAIALGAILSGCGIDQNRQREYLARYLPEAKCGDATFTLEEDQRGVRGDGLTSLAIRSPGCVRSIREALKRRGSRQVEVALNLAGWNIPGPDRPVGGGDYTFQGPDINLFLFREDGSVLWQSYSE